MSESRYPDPATSRAVLVGFGSYDDAQALPAIPAVRANLADLESALVRAPTGTLAAHHCAEVSRAASAADVGKAITTAAAEATDLLFVYYAGHGLVDERGRLYLALPSTDPARLRWTALPFDVLREEIAASPAATRVLVLDCCFSGRAIEAMGGAQSVITGQIDIAGTYTFTSTSATALSHAPAGARNTAFTGAMLAVVGNAGPLTLDEIFRQVDRTLTAHGMPRPQRRVVNAAGDLVLFKGSAPTAPVPQPAPAKPAPERTPPGSARRGAASLVVAYIATLLAASNIPLGVYLWSVSDQHPQAALTITADVQRALGVSAVVMAWTCAAYTLAFGVFIVLSATFAHRVGRRRLLAIGLTAFVIGSAVCMLSPDIRVFLAGRVVQGIGAGLICPLSLALVTAVLPSGKRRIAVAGWIAVAAAALLLIPLVDNAILRGLPWRWAFLADLPVGVILLVLVLIRQRDDQSASRARPVDPAGVVLVAAGLLALAFVPALLVRAAVTGYASWSSPASLAVLVGGLVLLGVFAARQLLAVP